MTTVLVVFTILAFAFGLAGMFLPTKPFNWCYLSWFIATLMIAGCCVVGLVIRLTA